MRKDYIARLVIEDFPGITANERSRLVELLKGKAKEIQI